jgi:hypothetical protein
MNMGSLFKNNMNCKLRLIISQFDYDQYSRCVNSVSRIVDVDCEGIMYFAGADWRYKLQSLPVELIGDGFSVNLVVEVEGGYAQQCNIALECVFGDWSVENYVLMPSAAYNGNRFESRRIAYSPKLLDPRDIGPDKGPVISDVPRLNIHYGPSFISDRSGSMSTPSMGFFSPGHQRGFWMLTRQNCPLGDLGYQIAENRGRDKAFFRVTAPVVREFYKYRITDNQFPSDDRAPDWKQGDNLELPLQLYFFDCRNIQALFDYWKDIRFNLIPCPEPVCSIPFSSTFYMQEEKFNRQNWVEKHGYYSVGMREMFLQDWQLGWTGGMITTYPLLFDGNKETRQRVMRNFDFLFPQGISPSGFFYDSGETTASGFNWYGGDIRKPHTANWHLVRKSGDGLYYILKQFRLMEMMGETVKPIWKEGARGVAEAFVQLWKNNGQTGQFVDSITGEIKVGGSTSAGIAPAALAYASVYFREPRYLTAAKELAANFYEKYIQKGLTLGGVGDALQNPDSESAYGVLESFAVLYEQTGEGIWLQRAEEMASQFLSWVMGYNYEFPPHCTLGQLDIKTFGAVFANTQNKHGAPGICTYSGVALLRLFRATGNWLYLDTLRDIARFIPQLLSTPGRPVPGLQTGWISERVSTTDWFEGIGELMTGSTWSETSLMLTIIEIPGIYVMPDLEVVYAVDALEVAWLHRASNGAMIRVKNPSQEMVSVKILSEDNLDREAPLGENYLFDCKRLQLLAGEMAEIEVPC